MIPKYQRIADRLREQLTNETNRMTKLPTEKELCARYQVSRQTIRQALQQLEHDGLIRRRQGSGAYATGLHPDSSHNRIAILLPSDSDYIYARLSSEIQQPLQKEGFSTTIHLTHHSVSKEREILRGLLDEPLRGLIVDPVRNLLPNPNLELYERLWAKQVPTVFLHNGYPNFPARICVTESDYAGACRLTQYLLDCRHTRLAAIFRMDTREGLQRYSGFADTCSSALPDWDDTHIGWYDTDDLISLQKKQDSGFLTRFAREKTVSCSAVICQDDEVAYWLIRELNRTGCSVPDDLSVVSFDNSYLCDFSVPGLTSLGTSDDTLAAAAARALLAQLRGQPSDSIRLTYELFTRSSCTRA